MKKNVILLIIFMLILSACTVKENKSVMQSDESELILNNKENIQKKDDFKEIPEGEACNPYTPQGQVLYDFESTSDYPEIEIIAKEYETATFGLGWFWEPSARFAAIEGVFRTRVGYAGGSSINPSYTKLGLHTEVVEIDYDPSIISYSDLIDEFFLAHDETLRPYDQRVKSLIFFRDDDELETAREKLLDLRENTKNGKSVFTELKEFSVFYIAEEKNQNRFLKEEISLYEEIRSKFDSEEKILLSVLASKLNGFVFGYGDIEEVEYVLERSSLSDPAIKRVREIISMRGKKE